MRADIKKEPFGTLPGGQEVSLYRLTNAAGMVVKITNYGAIITSIVTPDKNGEAGEVALGFEDLEGYLQKQPYFGSVVGRFANRIKNARFSINGQEYELAANKAPNHIHGGLSGFDKKVWQAEELPALNGLKLTYTSPDGEEGYPGNLETTITYSLTDDNELTIRYQATTDKATPVNLTNHSYFNLTAGKSELILDHVVQIASDAYTLVDDTQVPTGEVQQVEGTPMDFREQHVIGERIAQVPGGYDHNYIVPQADGSIKYVASVLDPESKRFMEVFTTMPGVQFYTGNALDGSVKDKHGKVFVKQCALCLETQHFPDAPNHEEFPSAILQPGETYDHTTIYKFSVKKGA
ncbi:galactose mutarotase [Pontibacter qinzhouensis]|uniref:Aldose 1-epimerase n=1 Tax=Pontibacter qinzhouensis TaxID=2603253 RepID=A0A5C8KF43_9BACT|nr:aldose epimerase family protein [Pontibacter qinzhouensis]TXK52167.1 galactose mutarotase [Pontibacter qinzhouensis]